MKDSHSTSRGKPAFPKKPRPESYGPYKITPPSGDVPFPAWRVVGPGLEMASSSEQTVRLRAIEAHACYKAGFSDGVDSAKR